MLLPQYNDEGEVLENIDPRKELVQKLLEYEKVRTDRIANFLLIEEPEAHIHTHIQKTEIAELLPLCGEEYRGRGEPSRSAVSARLYSA